MELRASSAECENRNHDTNATKERLSSSHPDRIMKKLTLLTLIVGLAGSMAAHAAYDGTVLIQNPGASDRDQTYGGGAFKATIQSGLANIVPQSPGSFLTFCLELSENLTLGNTYNANINDKAIQGSVGPSGDPISWGTAWLYSQFRAGSLGGTAALNKQLQEAIWWLEEETGSGANQPVLNSFVTDARDAYNTLYATSISALDLRDVDADGAFGVVVLNLYNASDARRQDVLAIVPEPSTYIAGGLALLPLLFGLRARWQKK